MVEAVQAALLRVVLERVVGDLPLPPGISVVAGFGEELAFRGWAIPTLAPMLGGGCFLLFKALTRRGGAVNSGHCRISPH